MAYSEEFFNRSFGVGEDLTLPELFPDFRVPVRIGQVVIEPGDILFGDVDGVLAIPRKAEMEVLTRALEKAGKRTFVHGFFGEVSLADYVMFNALHFDHHREQLPVKA